MTESSRSFLPRWLVRRWPLKLLSVALAFVTWLAVTTDNRLVQDYDAPLDVRLGDDAILTGKQVNRVRLRLRGSVGEFRRFDPARLRVELDLTGAAYGERTVQVESGEVHGVPPGVECSLIEPRVLSFTIARRGDRQLPVVPRLEGETEDGFEVYGWTVLPDHVRVEGPAQIVAGLESVSSDTISLEGRRESFAVQVSANPAEEDVRVIDPRLHTVRIELDEARKRRTFAEVAVHPIPVEGRKIRVSKEKMRLTLSGPPRILDALQPEQVRLDVDVSGLDPGPDSYTVEPQLRVLDIDGSEEGRIAIVSPESPTVKVWISNLQE